jgi:putative ABC transport system ATP-binding protein
MIRMKDIEKYYSNKFLKTWVLRQINLEIKNGDFITIMGPSGAGKSTLLYIMGMLDEPSGGEYYFYDEPVHQLKEKDRTRLHQNHIGFVFQQYHLIDELTVYEKHDRGNARPIQYCG